jgi:hypothetical protein
MIPPVLIACFGKECKNSNLRRRRIKNPEATRNSTVEVKHS